MYKLRRKKPNHPWSAIISLPGGKRIERSTRQHNKKLAHEVARRLDAEAAAQVDRVTLQEAIELVYAHKARKGDAAATLQKVEQKGSHLVTYFGFDRDVATIGLQHTTDYLVYRRQFVADSTVAMELNVLTQSLRYMRRLGRYHADPSGLWPEELPHSFPSRKRWLTRDEYEAVLLALLPRWKDHFVVYCWQGLRLAELYRLRPDDLQRGMLHIPGTKTERADRWMPISAEAAGVLGRRAREAGRGPLFPTESMDAKGKPNQLAQERQWHRALSTACERAGVPHASTNDLRRTFVTWCYHSRVMETEVIRWLGHTSAKMVRTVYAQSSEGLAADEMRKLQAPRSERRKEA